MKSIQQSNLVYFDKDLNQWVTDSYKMYQHFGIKFHRNLLRVIKRLIEVETKREEKGSLKNPSLHVDLFPSKLKTDNKVSIDGYKINQNGYYKVLVHMSAPKDINISMRIQEASYKLINAFQEMRDLIKNDLVSFPKSREDQLKLYSEIQSGDRVFRKACFPKANKNIKRPVKQDSELFQRIQRVSEFYFIGLEFEKDLIEFQQKELNK